jgi:hypothetical protein
MIAQTIEVGLLLKNGINQKKNNAYIASTRILKKRKPHDSNSLE